MKLGIAFSDFSWPVPARELGPTIINLARQADDAGFDSLWVMDHFFQISLSGGLPPESPMPEAYATLGVLAGQTRNIRLGTLVTSVAYRHPGVLLKTVTTLDVLSGGRMYLGVGAGAPFYRPPQGPGTAACLGRHDNRDAAAHAYLNTVSFPGSSGPTEACGTCHGTGKDWAVEKAHAR